MITLVKVDFDDGSVDRYNCEDFEILFVGPLGDGKTINVFCVRVRHYDGDVDEIIMPMSRIRKYTIRRTEEEVANENETGSNDSGTAYYADGVRTEGT